MQRYLLNDSTNNNVSISNAQLKKLLQKQCEIILKEKVLMDKELKLDKLIKEAAKLHKSRPLKDSKTALNLKEARKKMHQAIKTKEKFEKVEKKRKNAKKSKKRRAKSNKKRTNTRPLNFLHKFFDNYFKMDNKIKKIRSIKSKDFLTSLTRIILNPIYAPQLTKRSEYIRRQPVNAGDCYLMSLRKTPQAWIYHRWPKMYSPYYELRSQCKNCHFMCMFLLGFLFWIPCFILIEVCKCFLCCCCHDC